MLHSYCVCSLLLPNILTLNLFPLQEESGHESIKK